MTTAKCFSLYISLFLSAAVHPGITFDGAGSVLELGANGTLDLGNGSLAVSGEIVWASATGIASNNPLLYNGGTLRSAYQGNATLTGIQYNDAGASSTLTFPGDTRLVGRDGYVMLPATFSDPGNIIEGDVQFAQALTIPDHCSVELGLTRPLNKGITVAAGGVLSLSNDLICMNDVFISGNGDVYPEEYSITLAPRYTGNITGNIRWQGIRGLYLRGAIALAGDWAFEDTNFIDGNGAVIDLSAGGSLTVASGATLTLEDVTIRGVTSANLLLTDATSVLELRNARLELAADYAVAIGTIKVLQDSMFALRGYDVLVTDDAVLEVRYSTLTLNVISNTGVHDNTLFAPSPLFDEQHDRDVAAFDAGVAAGNLVFVGGGVITELTTLVSSAGDVAAVLEGSGVMAPHDILRFNSNATFDGLGAKVIFSNPGAAQMVVADGVDVTLANVSLIGITNSTFDLGNNSRVRIGENVTFELAEDISWPSQEIVITNSATFTVRSQSGTPRAFTMSSDPIGGDTPEDYVYSTHCDIGTGSLVLENVIFKGMRHVVFGSDDSGPETVYGDIVLHGDAVIEDDSLVIPHHIVVYGSGNKIVLRRDQMTFEGTIAYDPVNASALTFTTALPSAAYGTPRVYFGSKAVNVSSEVGQAVLNFDIPKVQVINNAADSFTLGVNSLLAGHGVDVDLYPIVHASARAAFRPGLRVTTSLSSGAFVLSEDLLDAMRNPFDVPATTSWMIKRMDARMLRRSIEIVDESLKPVVHYDSAVALPLMGGNITLKDSHGTLFTHWRVSDVRALNCTLYDGVSVQQAPQATTLKTDDILNVVGGTMSRPNTLYVTQDLTLNGALNFADGAVLCISVVPGISTPTITFGDDCTFSFGSGSALIFEGAGTIALPDAMTIPFADSNAQFILDQSMKMTVPYGQTLTATGTGSLICKNSAQCILENGAHMALGQTISDAVSLRVKSGGSVVVGGLLSSDYTARLSLVGSDVAFDFSQGGLLVLGEEGIAEINSLSGVQKLGNVTSCNFGSGGGLYISKNGSLQISSNNGAVDGLTFSFEGGSMAGSGTVGVLGSSFQGALQANIGTYSTQTAEQIVSALTQTVSALTTATVFANAQGQKVLRTKNGAFITLGTNDVILSDTDDGTVTGRQALSGRSFTYNANGVLTSGKR